MVLQRGNSAFAPSVVTAACALDVDHGPVKREV